MLSVLPTLGCKCPRVRTKTTWAFGAADAGAATNQGRECGTEHSLCQALSTQGGVRVRHAWRGNQSVSAPRFSLLWRQHQEVWDQLHQGFSQITESNLTNMLMGVRAGRTGVRSPSPEAHPEAPTPPTGMQLSYPKFVCQGSSPPISPAPVTTATMAAMRQVPPPPGPR